jgi:hypothetical protein
LRELPTGWETDFAAKKLIDLPDGYQGKAQALMDWQLALGGIQLAAILHESNVQPERRITFGPIAAAQHNSSQRRLRRAEPRTMLCDLAPRPLSA